MAGTMTLADIRTFVRTLISEPSASYWSDSELNNLINYGARDFCFQTQILEQIGTSSTVASQRDYALPSNYIALKQVEYWKASTVYRLKPDDLKESFTGYAPITGTPLRYNLFQETIRLDPRPSTSAASTTLGASLSSSATSATIASNSGFTSSGRVLIGSEVIGYTGTTSTTLTGLTRGLEGTTAAAGASGATVTQRDIYLYYTKEPATVSSDTATFDIPSMFDRALGYYAVWHARMKSRDFDLAKQAEDWYLAEVERGQTWIKKYWRDKVFRPK